MIFGGLIQGAGLGLTTLGTLLGTSSGLIPGGGILSGLYGQQQNQKGSSSIVWLLAGIAGLVVIGLLAFLILKG
jgi:hypothetical protein